MPITLQRNDERSGGSATSGSLGSGESVTVFSGDPGYQELDLRSGTAALPDENWSPLVHASRTISVSEAAFSGDGAMGLAAGVFATRALAGSQGQAIGVTGAAKTDSSHVGAHSNTDAVGVYGIGIATSSAGGSRSGIGGFFNGRTESTTAGTTGIEVVSDNETAVNGKHEPTGASLTKGIWLHATGTAGSGTGLQLGFTGRSFEVGVGFNSGSTSAADIRSDSQSQYSLRIRGKHAAAAASVTAEAGVLLLGTTTEIAIEPTAIFETPFIRMNATGLHFNGGTPVAIKAAGAAEASAIWTRLKELGLCT